ncbi:hypothetical protein [Alteribacillus sp. HJP-4]|uniref:hypothetical protein n=1 Tax=Alteribacillus sp. HJP-4 TaxID=2775394 RepID=UPI0035CCD311
MTKIKIRFLPNFSPLKGKRQKQTHLLYAHLRNHSISAEHKNDQQPPPSQLRGGFSILKLKKRLEIHQPQNRNPRFRKAWVLKSL